MPSKEYQQIAAMVPADFNVPSDTVEMVREKMMIVMHCFRSETAFFKIRRFYFRQEKSDVQYAASPHPQALLFHYPYPRQPASLV